MDDLISRQAAIDALGDMVMNWTDSEYELGQLNQWKADRKAIIDLPSAQPQSTMGQVDEAVQSTKDCISRQAAIDAIEEIDCSDGDGLSALKCDVVDNAVATIKALPHAQRIKGRWIHDGYDIPHGVDWMHCSVCGRREPHVPAAITNFCPTCGSDMRGEDDETD